MHHSYFRNALELIHNTPLVEIHCLRPPGGARLLAKHEGYNPGGSVKDRIALAMIEAAEQNGTLAPGGTIIEPTSGNTGIGLALVAAVKGYRCLLTMPETMSEERRKTLAAFGAELVLTPGAEGMRGAIAQAEALLTETPGGFIPQQFQNPANPQAHYEHTGPEIWEQAQGRVDAFVAGVGTGGTITGVGRYLRQRNPQVRIVAVEPAESPVLSGGEPGSHGIQGIGAGFVPGVLDTQVYTEVLTVTTEQAVEMAQRLPQEDGLFVGRSAGANLWAAAKAAGKMTSEQTVVTVLPDGGEKYLSLL
ncbi:MAG: cysteine synthase A [candidate division WS1 bacterium]|jgi:cysteine synthase A|nr:cysteine synthase A [candidate division WS1 bacterium]